MKDGKTTQAEVERALRNLFRLRIRLGMLDPPLSVPYYKVRYNDTELQFNQEHVAVAKKVRCSNSRVHAHHVLPAQTESDNTMYSRTRATQQRRRWRQ